MTRDELVAAIAGVKGQEAAFAADSARVVQDEDTARAAVAVLPVDASTDQIVAALDLAALWIKPSERKAGKTAADIGIDGQAWLVFNTLRGVEDTVGAVRAGDDVIPGFTFEDVRAIVAGQRR